MTTFGQVSQTCKSMHMMIIKSTCINIVLLTFSESTLAKSENLPYKDVDELGLMEEGLVVEYP